MNTKKSLRVQLAKGGKGCHPSNPAELKDILTRSRFWHLLPHGAESRDEAFGVYDAQTQQLLETPVTALQAFLAKHPFLFVISQNEPCATLHTTTRLLWTNPTNSTYVIDTAQIIVRDSRWANLEGWQIPTKDMLFTFAKAEGNPHRKGKKYRLIVQGGKESYEWLTTDGRCDVDEGYWDFSCSNPGFLFACHPLFTTLSDAEALFFMAFHGWRLRRPDGKTFKPGKAEKCPAESLFEMLFTLKLRLVPDGGSDDGYYFESEPSNRDFIDALRDLDYVPCRLPRLDDVQLFDPEKGLWELWGEEESSWKPLRLVARDPRRDVQRRAVAIDFGTSTTVVAVETESGGRELLRIGVRDFFQEVRPQDFENPTVLECIDYMAFHQAWTERAYRPHLDWDTMRAAHEALTNFRDNPGDPAVLASILPKLKQWALQESMQECLKLCDRKGLEIHVPRHEERNPVRGQPLSVSADDPFDPIELYAWYLGMVVNWRGRGLFLKYFMTFPVKYPRKVKNRILASFRRGLQRSLPETLIVVAPEVVNEFEVSELANEPAAYAAGTFSRLGLEPTEEGVPYGVFDFGGGTTDFNFGLLRWATAEEEERGYEQVFENLGSGGDEHLGGENLLEHLVYVAFQQNLPILREKRIQFTHPFGAPKFSGYEAFLASTRPAQTNTVLLSARLRPFLEGDEAILDSPVKIDLLDVNGTKQPCELVFDVEALDGLLARRIRSGVEAFLADLARLRSQFPPQAPIHILLAGNGSRSRHIKALFDPEGPHWPELLAQAFGDKVPQIVVHMPLSMDEKEVHAPTAKTGVALGLLRLAPGENTLLIDSIRERHGGEAPFAWFVGRLRRGLFDALIKPGMDYGVWYRLGPLQQNTFNLFVTTSPRGHNGLREGDPELKKYRLDFPAASRGCFLFAKVISPNELLLAYAPEKTAIEEHAAEKFLLV